jgi:3-vinyl bacteriochlorophyllide hydratase
LVSAISHDTSRAASTISRPAGAESQGTFTLGVVDRFIDSIDLCPWPTLAARTFPTSEDDAPNAPLYTPEERRRRDESRWTLVQGILAPVQFLAFLVSLGLVLMCLATGTGAEAATVSIVVKTALLYTIMVTGSIWEHDVFGCYLFAPAFFWEDVVSMLVLALHTAYLVVLVTGLLDVRGQLVLALAAYATYVVNATQFLLKLRAARREREAWGGHPGNLSGLAG